MSDELMLIGWFKDTKQPVKSESIIKTSNKHRIFKMSFAFAQACVPAVPVCNNKDIYFPIHRIYGFGASYMTPGLEVIKEERKLPFLFMKPADSVVICTDKSSVEVPYPRNTSDLRLEVELVVAIGKTAPEKGEVPIEEAEDYIFGYAVGLDLIKLDRMAELKAKNFAWEPGKSFDNGALITEIHEKSTTPNVDDMQLWLNIGNQLCQQGSPKSLLWKISEQINLISKDFRLTAGDLIYTGAPQGSSKINPGQSFEGGIKGITTFKGVMTKD